jgi:hypothetical protein
MGIVNRSALACLGHARLAEIIRYACEFSSTGFAFHWLENEVINDLYEEGILSDAYDVDVFILAVLYAFSERN